MSEPAEQPETAQLVDLVEALRAHSKWLQDEWHDDLAVDVDTAADRLVEQANQLEARDELLAKIANEATEVHYLPVANDPDFEWTAAETRAELERVVAALHKIGHAVAPEMFTEPDRG